MKLQVVLMNMQIITIPKQLMMMAVVSMIVLEKTPLQVVMLVII